MEGLPHRRVAFYTLGCKVNQYDTQSIKEQFIYRGYEVVDYECAADVYVINTCTVTGLADRKSRQAIQRVYKKNPESVIAVVGCYAQRDAQKVLMLPGVKLAVGTKNRSGIVDLIEKIKHDSLPVNAVQDIMNKAIFEEMPIKGYQDRTRAVLKIQDGCSQFCSYCIIPYARGPVRSRQPQEVIKEAKNLVSAGFKEIVLTGIHIASYGKDIDGFDILNLLNELHEIEGLARIRLGSLDPAMLSQSFIYGISSLAKLCRHYHVSLQSGSDSILKMMNRKYTADRYAAAVGELRQAIPLVAVTTDIMVGFPGESDEDFRQTLNFVDNIGFSGIHVFQYSPREGTPAAGFPGQISPECKDARSRQLISMGHKLEQRFMSTLLGTKAEVLFEGKSADCDGYYEGHTEHYIKVRVKSTVNITGKAMSILLDGVKQGYMNGKLEQ